MTTESISFICRNLQCTAEETNRRELIFHDKEQQGLFECPACKRLYKQDGDNTLYKPTDPEIESLNIDSIDAYLDLLAECQNTSLFIPRLHISGIKDAAYDGKIISFSKCDIGELILEDIDIKSAFYPFSFSECKVNKLIIRNCSIVNAGIKDYYSPWSFYGINLYKVKIKEQFVLEGTTSSVMIMDSDIKNPIDIRDKSNIELALLHNQDEPQVTVQKGSKYQQTFETSGRGTDAGKKIKTTGKAIQGLNIDVLEIDPKILTKTIVEDCRIKELILPDDTTNHALLYFRNCYIEKITGKPLHFERDVIFLGCTFVDDLPMLGANFKRSLILEACMFHKSVAINDLKIEKDLHLSYSCFMNGLHLSLLDIAGFTSSHFVLCNGDTKFSNLQTGRDITIRNISTKGEFAIKSCKIGGSLFIKRASIEQEFIINWIEAGDLNLDDIHVNKKLTIDNLLLNGSMLMNLNVHKEETEMSFNRINGEMIFANSTWHGDFSMMFNEMKTFWISGMDIKKEFTLDTCQIENKFSVDNCFFDDTVKISSSSFKDFNFSYNHVYGEMTMSNFHGSSLDFIDNLFGVDFSLRESVGGNLKWDNNFVQFTLAFFNMELRDLNVSGNIVGHKLEISYLKAYDIDLFNDIFYCQIEMNNISANNFNVMGSQFLPYPENQKTDDWKEHNKDITESVILNQLNTSNININDNIVMLDSKITNASSNLFKLFDNQFYENFKINSPEAERLVFKGNQTEEAEFANGRVGEVILSGDIFNGTFRFNNVSTGKDLDISSCIFHSDAFVLYCGIEKDLEFADNQCNNDFLLKGCRIGNNINLTRNIYRKKFFLGLNAVIGDISMNDKMIREDFLIKNNNIQGSLILKDTTFYYTFFMDENTVGQQLLIDNSNFNGKEYQVSKLEWKEDFNQLVVVPKYSFRSSPEPVTFIRNKFNFVYFNKCYFNNLLNFYQNVVEGKLRWGLRTSGQEGFSGIYFNEGVSLNENRIRSIEMNNLAFKSGLCQRNNHIESGYTLFNTDFDKVFDLTGSFIGGTFAFEKRDLYKDGHLILDNTYIDKRIRFVQTEPSSISFINATFNGFEIPSFWRMRGKRLINKDAERGKQNLFREANLKKVAPWEAELPYSIINSYCNSVDMIASLATKWAQIQWRFLNDPETVEVFSGNIPGFNQMMKHHKLIAECISSKFVSVFLGFYNQDHMKELINIASDFAFKDVQSDDENLLSIHNHFRGFFSGFYYALKFNIQEKIHWENENDKKFRHLYKYALNDNLHEQYQVLRGIYGGNGELENEDTAYYWWKHYLNISDMQGASWKRKLRNGFKSVFYETIFGWGVKLPRIVLSTLIMVLIFSGIYGMMFLSMPELYVMWDNTKVFAPDIGPLRWIVFALQTTFSAVLGDWAPIGAGIIKIPMTINAILGVLFVTFLIGAYGRKMLR